MRSPTKKIGSYKLAVLNILQLRGLPGGDTGILLCKASHVTNETWLVFNIILNQCNPSKSNCKKLFQPSNFSETSQIKSTNFRHTQLTSSHFPAVVSFFFVCCDSVSIFSNPVSIQDGAKISKFLSKSIHQFYMPSKSVMKFHMKLKCFSENKQIRIFFMNLNFNWNAFRWKTNIIKTKWLKDV